MQHFELPAKTGCLCRYDHGASILRLKKVPEMETMWFPLVDFRCLRGCRAMINRFSNFRYISLKNG
jgi:hypothetical protein